jgi:hypothetical protein
MINNRLAICVILCGASIFAPGDRLAAADWPQYMGPTGSLASVTPGVVLAGDPAIWRHLWTSEERGLGCGKNWSQYPQPNMAPDRPLPGGLASPVLAEGLIHLHYFQPKEGPLATGYHNYKAGAPAQAHYRILAEDVDVAIDAATGRTVWKRTGGEPGLNLFTTKRGGWGVTGCVHEGRYFALDTLGRVLAYDAKTGKPLWQAGDAAGARTEREAAVGQHRFAKMFLAGHLAVIGGHVIAPQYGGRLIALDPASGAERWTWKGDIAQFASAAFRAGVGRDLALVPGFKGVTCLDPANGAVLWHLDGPLQDFLTTYQDVFLFVDCGKEAFVKDKDKDRTNARWALYRARPEGPELVWRSTVMTGCGSDGGPQRRAPIDGVLAYLPGTLETTPPLSQYTDTTVVDLKTGAVVFHKKTALGGPDAKSGMHVAVRWDNLLLSRCEADSSGVRCVRTATGEGLGRYSIWDGLGHFHYGYQTVTLDAYGDGIAYVRHLYHGGCIQAWDLRAR